MYRVVLQHQCLETGQIADAVGHLCQLVVIENEGLDLGARLEQSSGKVADKVLAH